MLFDPHLFTLFLIGLGVLVIIPGPDTLLVLSRSLTQGGNAGTISALGIGTGNLCHAIMATLGLSAIIAASPQLFLIVQYAGAAYLLVIGLISLKTAYQLTRTSKKQASHTLPTLKTKNASAKRIFMRGLMTNLMNVKVILFQLSFIPQFVSQATGPVWAQTFIYGLIIALTGVFVHTTVARTATKARDIILNNRFLNTAIEAICGILFIGFALRIFILRHA